MGEEHVVSKKSPSVFMVNTFSLDIILFLLDHVKTVEINRYGIVP